MSNKLCGAIGAFHCPHQTTSGCDSQEPCMYMTTGFTVSSAVPPPSKESEVSDEVTSWVLLLCWFGFILIGFLAGYLAGTKEIRELEKAGYKIVKHEIRHDEFHTNWIEVIKGDGK